MTTPENSTPGMSTPGISSTPEILQTPEMTVTQAPVTQAPVTQAPVTQPPATQAPVSETPKAESSPWSDLASSIFWTILIIAAIFTSIVCRDGFDLFHVLGACCCAPCYLPYGIWCAFFKKKPRAF